MTTATTTATTTLAMAEPAATENRCPRLDSEKACTPEEAAHLVRARPRRRRRRPEKMPVASLALAVAASSASLLHPARARRLQRLDPPTLAQFVSYDDFGVGGGSDEPSSRILVLTLTAALPLPSWLALGISSDLKGRMVGSRAWIGSPPNAGLSVDDYWTDRDGSLDKLVSAFDEATAGSGDGGGGKYLAENVEEYYLGGYFFDSIGPAADADADADGDGDGEHRVWEAVGAAFEIARRPKTDSDGGAGEGEIRGGGESEEDMAVEYLHTVRLALPLASSPPASDPPPFCGLPVIYSHPPPNAPAGYGKGEAAPNVLGYHGPHARGVAGIVNCTAAVAKEKEVQEGEGGGSAEGGGGKNDGGDAGPQCSLCPPGMSLQHPTAIWDASARRTCADVDGDLALLAAAVDGEREGGDGCADAKRRLLDSRPDFPCGYCLLPKPSEIEDVTAEMCTLCPGGHPPCRDPGAPIAAGKPDDSSSVRGSRKELGTTCAGKAFHLSFGTEAGSAECRTEREMYEEVCECALAGDNVFGKRRCRVVRDGGKKKKKKKNGQGGRKKKKKGHEDKGRKKKKKKGGGGKKKRNKSKGKKKNRWGKDRVGETGVMDVNLTIGLYNSRNIMAQEVIDGAQAENRRFSYRVDIESVLGIVWNIKYPFSRRQGDKEEEKRQERAFSHPTLRRRYIQTLDLAMASNPKLIAGVDVGCPLNLVPQFDSATGAANSCQNFTATVAVRAPVDLLRADVTKDVTTAFDEAEQDGNLTQSFDVVDLSGIFCVQRDEAGWEKEEQESAVPSAEPSSSPALISASSSLSVSASPTKAPTDIAIDIVDVNVIFALYNARGITATGVMDGTAGPNPGETYREMIETTLRYVWNEKYPRTENDAVRQLSAVQKGEERKGENESAKDGMFSLSVRQETVRWCRMSSYGLLFRPKDGNRRKLFPSGCWGVKGTSEIQSRVKNHNLDDDGNSRRENSQATSFKDSKSFAIRQLDLRMDERPLISGHALQSAKRRSLYQQEGSGTGIDRTKSSHQRQKLDLKLVSRPVLKSGKEIDCPPFLPPTNAEGSPRTCQSFTAALMVQARGTARKLKKRDVREDVVATYEEAVVDGNLTKYLKDIDGITFWALVPGNGTAGADDTGLDTRSGTSRNRVSADVGAIIGGVVGGIVLMFC